MPWPLLRAGAAHYRRLIQLWWDADPELRRPVEEAEQ